MYAKLGYPSVKYFMWISKAKNRILSSDIPRYRHGIWGKKIVAFKSKTTRKKPVHVAGDIVIIPKELVKLYKYVFMTAEYSL